MTSTQVVQTSATNNSSFQNYNHPDDHILRMRNYISKGLSMRMFVCFCTVKSFYKIRHRINSLLQRGKVLKTVKYAAKKIPVRCKQVALKGAYTCGNWKEILGVGLCLTF